MGEKNQVRRFTIAAFAEFMDRVSDPQAVCTLQVSDGYSERIVYFAAGGVRLLSVGERGGPDIPSFLLDNGRITIEDLHVVLEGVRTTDMNLQQVLAKRGVLEADEFKALASRFIRNEIFDLVFWEDTYYKVFPTSPPNEIFTPDRPALTGKLNFAELGEDANRWIADWNKYRKTLQGDEVSLFLTGGGREAEKTEAAEVAAVLKACKGGHTLRNLRRSLDMPLPVVCRHLVDFVQKRWVTVVPPERAALDVHESIAALEDALPRVIDRELVQEKLAHLYRQAKDGSKATAQLTELAREALAREDKTVASEIWQQIVALRTPNDEAFKDYVRFHLKRDEFHEVNRLALSYASSLEEGGELDVGDDVARTLRGIRGAKLPALEFQAEWLILRNRTLEAAEPFRRVIRAYADKGDTSRALELAERAMMMVPEDGELSASVSELRRATSAREQERARTAGRPNVRRGGGAIQSKVLTVLVAVAVVGAMNYFGVFEKLASQSDAVAEATAPAGSGSGPGPAMEYLPGVGYVPAGGRKGLDARDTFVLNGDGSVSTPLGVIGPGLASASGGGASPNGGPPGLPPSSDAQLGGFAALMDGGQPPATASDSSASPFSSGAGSLPRRPRPSRVAVPTPRVVPRSTPRGAGPPVDGAPCHHQGFHRLTVRSFEEQLAVAFASGCDLSIYNTETGERNLRLVGDDGARWVVHQGALTICRWKPGEPVRFYNRFGTRGTATRWALPKGTEALAASEDYIAVRAGSVTGVFRRDGSPVERREMPSWDEGLFLQDALILLSGPTAQAPHGSGVRAYHAATLQLLWSSIASCTFQ